MEFNNKIKPKTAKRVKPTEPVKTNYNSFINPFERSDTQLANKTFEEVKDLFKSNYQIDLTDAAEGDTNTSYRGKAWKHYAPSPHDVSNETLNEYDRRVAPISNATNIYKDLFGPRDEWDVEERYYEYGTDGRDYSDQEMDEYTFKVYENAKNNPEAEITVYRVMPNNKNIINTGDWVTVNLQYALMFYDLILDKASQGGRLPKQYHIVAKKVKAKDLFVAKRDSTDDWHSAGYYPQK